jgi:hypothetical protein
VEQHHRLGKAGVRAVRVLVLLAACAAGCTDWSALSDCAVAQSEGRRCGDAGVAAPDAGRDAGPPDAAAAPDAGPPALDAGPPLELTVALTLPGRLPQFFLETEQGLRLVTVSKGGAGGFAEVLALESSDAGVALVSFQTLSSSTSAPQLLDAAGGLGAFVVTEPGGGFLRLYFDPPGGAVVENRSFVEPPRVGIFRAAQGPAACLLGVLLAGLPGGVALYPDGGTDQMVLSGCFGKPVTAVLTDDQRCVTVGVRHASCSGTPALQVQFGNPPTADAGAQLASVPLFAGTTGAAALARFEFGLIIAFAALDRLVVEPRGKSFEVKPAYRQVLLPLGSVESPTQTLRGLSADALLDSELIVTGTRFSTGLQTEEGSPVLLPRGPGSEGEGFVLRRSGASWRSAVLPGAYPLAALGIGDRFLVALECAGNAAAPCLGVTGTVIVEAR